MWNPTLTILPITIRMTTLPESEGSRARALADLPLRVGDLVIRSWTRGDLEQLAAWPAYPFPYETFRFSFAEASRAALDCLFEEREGDPARITLAAYRNEVCVGYLALLEIDWRAGLVGNLGIRVHPEHCGRGVGSTMLCAIVEWGAAHGLTSLRLDVAASNARAVRCYEKAGFHHVSELWRPAPDLRDVDLSEPTYDSIRPHVRFSKDGELELHFLVMKTAVS